MKPKTLIPLAIILAVLVGLVVLKSAMNQPPSITEQVSLPPLVPADISAADMGKFELFAGKSPDEAVVVARSADDPDVWTVESHFNALAAKDKVEDFVKSLAGLKGEFRAAASSDEDLEEYGLTEDLAFHVRGYKKGVEEPAFELLLGKAPASTQVLARTAGSNDIFVVNVNLRRDAEIWQDDAEQKPQATAWLNKEVLNIAKADITRLEISSPDKRIVFEQKAVETPDKDKGEAESAESEPEAPEDAAAAETEWILTEGGPGGEFKQTGLDSLLGAFAPLTALDVMDPSKKAEYGLETPAFVTAISVKDKEEPMRIEGGRPDPSGDGYVRIAGAESEVIFKVSKWNFERVFPKGRDLFELAGLSVDANAIDRIEVTQPEGKLVLAKEAESEDWNVLEPVVDLKPQTSTLRSVATALASWKPADYADSASGAGFAETKRQVVFTTKDGESHTIVLGADSKGIDGAYAKLDGADTVGIMGRSEMDRVFIPRKDAFVRDLLDIDAAAIRSIIVKRSEDDFEVKRGPDGWSLRAAGQDLAASQSAVDDVANAIAELQASSIRFGETGIGAGTLATVRCVMQDNTEHTLTIGQPVDGAHPLTLSGMSVAFEIEPGDVARILPASAALKKPEPAAAADAADAPAAATDAADAPAADADAVDAPAAATDAADAPAADADAVDAPAGEESPGQEATAAGDNAQPPATPQ